VQSFRRHQRLFLIALVLFLAQTILALAHVHASSSARHASAAADACGLGNEYPCNVPAPPGHDEHCPLCAAISTACALVLPAPVAIPSVVPRSASPAAIDSAKVDARDAESHYQPRAPPLRVA
jgi:hypothetical protein